MSTEIIDRMDQGMRLVPPPDGFVAPARVTAAPRLSQRHPRLYPVAVWVNRARRRVNWLHADAIWARDEAFIKSGDDVFRRNEIWRTVIDKRTGRALREERLKQNCALVKYHPIDVDVIDCALADAGAAADRL